MPQLIRVADGPRFPTPGPSLSPRRSGRFAARTPGHDRTDPPACEPASQATIDWNDLLPRQVVGIGGGFVAAVGMAAMAITGSSEGLVATLAGLAAVAGGFAADLAPRFREAIGPCSTPRGR